MLINYFSNMPTVIFNISYTVSLLTKPFISFKLVSLTSLSCFSLSYSSFYSFPPNFSCICQPCFEDRFTSVECFRPQPFPMVIMLSFHIAAVIPLLFYESLPSSITSWYLISWLSCMVCSLRVTLYSIYSIS